MKLKTLHSKCFVLLSTVSVITVLFILKHAVQVKIT